MAVIDPASPRTLSASHTSPSRLRPTIRSRPTASPRLFQKRLSRAVATPWRPEQPRARGPGSKAAPATFGGRLVERDARSWTAGVIGLHENGVSLVTAEARAAGPRHRALRQRARTPPFA